MREERLGGLRVWITGGSDGHGGGNGPAIILLHGFGAPGNDLVPLAEVISAPLGTRFVFPEAPLSLQMGFGDSRAWWMLDLERRQRELASGTRDLTREVPVGLAEARAKAIAMLEELVRRHKIDLRRCVLGGFSQGAMLACDLVLRSEMPVSGLVLLSGTLIAKDEWLPLLPKRRGLKVFMSHGSRDPLLPLAASEQLRDLLLRAGLVVEWVGFHGGHEIPEAVAVRLGSFLRAVL